MKKFSFLFVLILLVSGLTYAQNKYKVEKGFIEYKMDMMGMTMNSQTYFKDYGAVSAQTVSMFGNENRTLVKDDYVYSLDMNSKTGVKMPYSQGEGMSDFDYDNIPQDIKEKYNIVEEGNESVAGKDCKIFSMESEGAKSRMWIWKNIPLKMVVEKEGVQMTMVATTVNTNPDFPAGIFEVPADFTISEGGE